MANSVFFPQKPGMTLGGNLLFSNETFNIGNAASNRPLNIRVATNGSFVGAGGSFLSLGSGGNINSFTSGAGNNKIQLAGAGFYSWTSRSRIFCNIDGRINLLNAANSNFSRLTLGLESALFPSLENEVIADEPNIPRLKIGRGDGSAGAARLAISGLKFGPFVYDITSPNRDGSVSQQTAILDLNYAHFIDAALTSEIILAVIAAKTKIVSVIADTTTPYAGLAGTITLMFGYGATPNEFILAHDVKTAIVTRGLADADLGAGLARATAIQGGVIPSWAANTNLKVRITSGVGNIGTGGATNMTAGVTRYYITYEVLNN